METTSLKQVSESEWQIEPHGNMRVPAILFASEELIRDMDEKVREQIVNVASLPGIQKAAYAMPDAHWGYGFPIGGVAAFGRGSDKQAFRKRPRKKSCFASFGSSPSFECSNATSAVSHRN